MPEQAFDVRRYDALEVRIYHSPREVGRAAARRSAEILRAASRDGLATNVLFSTGASQFEYVDALRSQDDIDFSRMTGFHLDEYLGIPMDHPASFRRWLRDRVEVPLAPRRLHYIDGNGHEPETECERYARLLEAHPIHLALIGIGENGHIAFNEPDATDFDDPRSVRVITLDARSRSQQVDEGWFASVDEVPAQAITLTVPAILRSNAIISVVPAARKAAAVKRALEGPIDASCPASILRRHPNASLFLDAASAAKLAPVRTQQRSH